jgi:hypothetical protein
MPTQHSNIPPTSADASDSIQPKAVGSPAQNEEPKVPITKILLIPVVMLIGGCGAEVAGTAATAASLQAAQAQQAKAQQEEVKKKLSEAMKATEAAASAAGNQ